MGFTLCNTCGKYILWESPDCHSILRYIKANHNCPDTNNDDRIGLDIEADANSTLLYILQNKLYILIRGP